LIIYIKVLQLVNHYKEEHFYNGSSKDKKLIIEELNIFRKEIENLGALKKELRTKEDRYHNLFEESRDAIIITSKAGKFIDFNQAALDLFGYSADEMTGMDVRQIYVNVKDRARFQEAIEKRGSVRDYEIKLCKKDGTEMDCLFTLTLRSKEAKILGYQGIIRDITDYKQVEKLYMTVANRSQVGVYVVRKGKFRFVNPHIIAYSGFSEEDLLGRDTLSLVHSEDRDMVRENAIKMLKNERQHPYEYRLITRDGRILWILETLTSIVYYGERAVLGNSMNITEERKAKSELEQQTYNLNKRIKELNCLYSISDFVEKDMPLEDILRGTVNIIPTAMQYPEKSCARIIVGELEFRTENFRETYYKIRKDVVVGDEQIGAVEIYYLTEEGSEKSKDAFLEEEKGLAKAIAERLGRIIERKRNEEALRESELKYSTFVGKARDGIATIQDHVFKFVNKAMTEISGYTTEELVGMDFLDIFTSEYRDLLSERYEKRLSGEEIPPVYETKIQQKNGKFRHVEVSFGLITYNGKPADMGFFRDITKRINAEQEIIKLAHHDALTGLPNRVLFNEHFILAEAHARRNKQKMGVMLLDLDYFKEINDTLGHNVGDQLLQVVGSRLTSLVRKEDVVARMGGDEFMILLQEIEHSNDVVTTSQKIVEALRYPFIFGGHDIHITISLGAAIYPEDGEDIHTLLKNADIAMYRVKEKSRNDYQLYAQSEVNVVS